jgi:hypothetical protein
VADVEVLNSHGVEKKEVNGKPGSEKCSRTGKCFVLLPESLNNIIVWKAYFLKMEVGHILRKKKFILLNKQDSVHCY